MKSMTRVDIQRPFLNIQGIFSEHSGNIQGTFSEHTCTYDDDDKQSEEHHEEHDEGGHPAALLKHSGNIQ
jgi:hypothetical protein